LPPLVIYVNLGTFFVGVFWHLAPFVVRSWHFYFGIGIANMYYVRRYETHEFLKTKISGMEIAAMQSELTRK